MNISTTTKTKTYEFPTGDEGIIRVTVPITDLSEVSSPQVARPPREEGGVDRDAPRPLRRID